MLQNRPEFEDETTRNWDLGPIRPYRQATDLSSEKWQGPTTWIPRRGKARGMGTSGTSRHARSAHFIELFAGRQNRVVAPETDQVSTPHLLSA